MNKKIKVQVYMYSNRVFEYDVSSLGKAREHAKRIVIEGFIADEEDGTVYYPVHQVFKVKIVGMPLGKYRPRELNL
jgi:hypothetical protein